MAGRGEPARRAGLEVSATSFDTRGVRPALGSTFGVRRQYDGATHRRGDFVRDLAAAVRVGPWDHDPGGVRRIVVNQALRLILAGLGIGARNPMDRSSYLSTGRARHVGHIHLEQA